MSNINIHKDEEFIPDLTDALKENHQLTSWELFNLLYNYKKATIIQHSDKLHVLSTLHHIKLLDHQIDTVKTVINEMNGRAILADEVGLGKTIEAGMILKEYFVRGLVKKALILVPSTLVNQWVEELREKFYLVAQSYRKNYRWDTFPITVASIDLAKRIPHREEISKIAYDIVIVDEAHKLKNEKTLNYSLIKMIQKKYCLLLTATPVQNHLFELFNLVSIIKPGYLGNYETFKRKYIQSKHPENKNYLHQLIQKVMVRNRRKDTLLHDVKRNVETIWLQFTEAEQATYEQLADLLKAYPAFFSTTYLKELCSSREACYLSLQQSKNDQLKKEVEPILENIANLPHHIKAHKLVELIESFAGEKVIVFTQYRATQYYLQWYLQQHKISAISFYGGLKSGRKDWIRSLFQNEYQVLITTEAGGEGINLQFCRYLINYDLPWNPLRVEQRIGRIHRYGQQGSIHIYNLAIKQTLEEQMMFLLYDKIKMFEQVIGKLDYILENLQIGSIDEEIEQIVKQSNSFGEMKIKLNNFVHVLEHFSKSEEVK